MKFCDWLKKRINEDQSIDQIGAVVADLVNQGIGAAQLAGADQKALPAAKIADTINKRLQTAGQKNPALKAVKIDAAAINPLLQQKEKEQKAAQAKQGIKPMV